MIIGLGVDMVDIERVRRVRRDYGERFARRVLAASEQDDYRSHADPARFLAKRFAVKEACAKALGTGFRNGVRLADIGMGHDAFGAPRLELAGRARERLRQMGGGETFLTLSDERSSVIAVVIITRVSH